MYKRQEKTQKEGDFEALVLQFLKRKEVKILERTSVVKNKELNFIVQIPSGLGELQYFVKAKNKRSLNEGDLLLAFAEGQHLKLPTLYLSSGDPTRKAKDYLGKYLKGMNFLKMKQNSP